MWRVASGLDTAALEHALVIQIIRNIRKGYKIWFDILVGDS